MKIERLEISNYRMLKNFSMSLEDDLSLVIGRNNSGKTSLLTLLKSFLKDNGKSLQFDDFNIDLQKEIIETDKSDVNISTYKDKCIDLTLYIKYNPEDDLASASKLLLDLDDSNFYLVIQFKFIMNYENYLELLNNYKLYKENGSRTFEQYISRNLHKYFNTEIFALEYNNEENKKEISFEIVKSIISLEFIAAKRNVDNKDGKSVSLSTLANKFYEVNLPENSFYPDLDRELLKTDKVLTNNYKEIFKNVVQEIKVMSYNGSGSEISIHSTLSDNNFFLDNTTVKYSHDKVLLPEDYNGLGYLNLFSIVFNIILKVEYLLKNENRKSTPLNLIFIEEPEVHTHPQMQYIFIKNIKELINSRKSQGNVELQTIMTTHSPHIVSQSNFDDIKYFFIEEKTSVKSRDLKLLSSKLPGYINNDKEVTEKVIDEISESMDTNFRFLKKYLTLNNSELLFAEKAVLIEGDTERILLPVIMQKLDLENKDDEYIPLMSQNISIIEAGAYSHVLAAFLDFVGVKTLITTDLDSGKKNENNRFSKAAVANSTETTNPSIKHFTQKKNLDDLLAFAMSPITLNYCSKDNKWIMAEDGKLRIVFQQKENEYVARSFEDAFVSINIDYLFKNKESFVSLQNINLIQENATNYYEIAESCIKKKTDFALDIIVNSKDNFSNWDVPSYLKEGLKWLNK